MKFKTIAALFLMINLATINLSYAHSSMTMTPENGAMLGETPEYIEIKFSKMVRMLKFDIKDAAGNEVNYTTKNTKKYTDIYKAETDILASGDYFITWRAIGKDGHPVKNKFGFSVK